MSNMDLKDIDLNLLLVLDVLLQERHVTKASVRLHRSQSAISHALARLRQQLDDPILVREGGEMRPSPWAQRVGPELQYLLRAMQSVLRSSPDWKPEDSRRTFTIVGPDFAAVVLPRLFSLLSEQAPMANVELVPTSDSMFHDVASGTYDVGIFRTMDVKEDVICHPLISHPQMVFMRREHPARQNWGLESWLAYPHIRIRITGGASPVDIRLSESGLTRTNGPVLPNFMMAPALLQHSDLFFTAPYGILSAFASQFDVVALPCPLDLPPIDLALYFSRRLQSDPESQWFGKLAAQAFMDIIG